ncbi:Hypothetical predicted protein [Prunus dulcis]|uniref:Uncharacterized protein n=1 Tax=Prunus dulcis TaxID=3755 RepID=A0A5E4GD53_PRUDU|nr:Hypothetical predicted protein [Prunus dulcis]
MVEVAYLQEKIAVVQRFGLGGFSPRVCSFDSPFHGVGPSFWQLGLLGTILLPIFTGLISGLPVCNQCLDDCLGFLSRLSSFMVKTVVVVSVLCLVAGYSAIGTANLGDVSVLPDKHMETSLVESPRRLP